MSFAAVAVDDTDAVACVAATIVAEHARGVNVVAVLPPYGRAIDELARLAAAVSSTPHPRELDMLVSSGASMSAALCAMAIHRRGCRAVSLEGAQAGIITDANHTRAEILEIDTDRMTRELRHHGVVLVSGIHGIARATSDPTTLRDDAAVALAEALDAAACVVVAETGRVNGSLPISARAAARARDIGLNVEARALEAA